MVGLQRQHYTDRGIVKGLGEDCSVTNLSPDILIVFSALKKKSIKLAQLIVLLLKITGQDC